MCSISHGSPFPPTRAPIRAKNRKSRLGSLAALTLLVAGAVASQGCDQSRPAPPGAQLGDLALPSINNGEIFDPTHLRGKTVLVNFWRPG